MILPTQSKVSRVCSQNFHCMLNEEYAEQEEFPAADAHLDTAGAEHGDEPDENLPREDRDADDQDSNAYYHRH